MKGFLVFTCCTLFIISCVDKQIDSNKIKEKPNGTLLYKRYCAACHGENGKLGANKAADLSLTIMSQENQINIISEGKGYMPPHKNMLHPDEIKVIVTYIEAFKAQ